MLGRWLIYRKEFKLLFTYGTLYEPDFKRCLTLTAKHIKLECIIQVYILLILS
jgi:hypothetical protein